MIRGRGPGFAPREGVNKIGAATAGQPGSACGAAADRAGVPATFQDASGSNTFGSTDAMRFDAMGRPPKVEGSYDWLRRSNFEQHREMRRQLAAQTLQACSDGGYQLADGRFVKLRNDDEAKRDQVEFVVAPLSSAAPLPGQGSSPSGMSSGSSVRFFQHAQGTIVSVAQEQAQRCPRVAVVNAASAYHVGGGFHDGGRHALEESLCTQTTLFRSLKRAKDIARSPEICDPRWAQPPSTRHGNPWRIHIPVEKAILSRGIQVFRGSTFDGYPFLERPVELAAVISVAMPNCNPNVRGAPVDRPPDDITYRGLVFDKFRAVLAAARKVEADALVVPEAGCGVYQNDPRVIGHALGRALREHQLPRLEVHLVSSDEFAKAVKAGLDGHTDEAPAPAPPPQLPWPPCDTVVYA